jgi:hypothetical protein
MWLLLDAGIEARRAGAGAGAGAEAGGARARARNWCV